MCGRKVIKGLNTFNCAGRALVVIGLYQRARPDTLRQDFSLGQFLCSKAVSSQLQQTTTARSLRTPPPGVLCSLQCSEGSLAKGSTIQDHAGRAGRHWPLPKGSSLYTKAGLFTWAVLVQQSSQYPAAADGYSREAAGPLLQRCHLLCSVPREGQ